MLPPREGLFYARCMQSSIDEAGPNQPAAAKSGSWDAVASLRPALGP